MSKNVVEISLTPAAGELWVLENQWAMALQNKDSDVLSHLLADTFISTSVQKDFEPVSKAAYISEASLAKIVKCEVDDFCVRQSGNLAVVKEELRFQSPALENRADQDLLVVDVWFRDGNQWKAMTRLVSKAAQMLTASQR